MRNYLMTIDKYQKEFKKAEAEFFGEDAKESWWPLVMEHIEEVVPIPYEAYHFMPQGMLEELSRQGWLLETDLIEDGDLHVTGKIICDWES